MTRRPEPQGQLKKTYRGARRTLLVGVVEKVPWSDFGWSHAFEVHSPLEGESKS